MQLEGANTNKMLCHSMKTNYICYTDSRISMESNNIISVNLERGSYKSY